LRNSRLPGRKVEKETPKNLPRTARGWLSQTSLQPHLLHKFVCSSDTDCHLRKDMSAVEALYVFDNFSPATTPILQHEWRSRPATTAASLYSLYKAQPSPRPSLIYLPTTSPPTLLFNIIHNNLLFLSPTTSEIEPLLISEFLHRVIDVLEDYLGSPLLGSKIEANYDIVAQLLNEMCDDGFPFTTEPNALRDVVLPPSLMGKLLGSVTGLPRLVHPIFPQYLSTAEQIF